MKAFIVKSIAYLFKIKVLIWVTSILFIFCSHKCRSVSMLLADFFTILALSGMLIVMLVMMIYKKP